MEGGVKGYVDGGMGGQLDEKVGAGMDGSVWWMIEWRDP